MKYFALAMSLLCLGLAALPPIISWISLIDVGLAAWWFWQYRLEGKAMSEPICVGEGIGPPKYCPDCGERIRPSVEVHYCSKGEGQAGPPVRAVAAGAGDPPSDYSFEDMSDAECQHVMEHLFGISMTAGYRRADYDWFRRVLTNYFTRREADRRAAATSETNP